MPSRAAARQPPRRTKPIPEPPISAIEASIQMLVDEVARLRTAIETLVERIPAFDPAQIRREAKPAASRAVTDDAAKREIKVYFEQRHGETVYPSDIADELNLDYERTIRLVSELESDGCVARA